MRLCYDIYILLPLAVSREHFIATTNQITQKKRNRERAQKEARQDKDSKRSLRKEEKIARKNSVQDGVDPDLVGIYPGPQPVVYHKWAKQNHLA